jgi:hypothetical protein
MPEQTRKLTVKLTTVGQADQPISANHTHLSVAQGIAYLDFGFIEPSALAVLSRAAREGKAMPERLDGKLVARVAMGLDVLQRLDQQLQQVLQGLRGTKPTKPGKK